MNDISFTVGSLSLWLSAVGLQKYIMNANQDFLISQSVPKIKRIIKMHFYLFLVVNKKLQIIPYESEEEETGLVLIMVLYYACLMETQ